jgi:chromosome partitioning protein
MGKKQKRQKTGQGPTVIDVANRGGSAGKTTTVVNLAAMLGGAGQRVLVVDADAQANATRWLGVQPGAGPAVGDVMLGNTTLDEAICEATSAPGVALVPASPELDQQLVALAGVIGAEFRLARALERLAGFDVVLIDSPGSGQTMSVATLLPADAAITVARPTLKEIQGVQDFLGLVREVAAAYKPALRTVAVIPCDVPPKNAGGLYQDSLALMAAQPWSDLITPTVRHSVRVPEAYAAQMPLTCKALRGEPVTLDYLAVLDWLADKRVVDW